MKTWRQGWLLVVASILFVSLGRTQERPVAFVPVGDLLRSGFDSEPYLLPLALYGEGRRLWGEQALVPFADGEQPARRQPAWFDGDALVTLLANQTQLAKEDMFLVRGGTLLGCPRAGVDKVRGALDGIRQRLPAQVAVELELTRTRAGTTELLLARRIEACSGRVRVASATVQTTALVDFEVEIAQAAAAGNPVVKDVLHGAMVVLRPHVVPSGEAAIVELLVRVVEPLPGSPIAPGHPGFGAIDRVRQGVHEWARVLRTNLGGKVDQRWSGPDGADYRLSLQLQWQVPPPPRPGVRDFEYAAIGSALLGFVGVDGSHEFDEADEKRLLAADTFAALLQSAGIVAEEPSEVPLRSATDRDARPLGQAVAAMFDAMTQAPPIDVEFYDAPSGARLPLEGPLPAGVRRIGAVTLECVDDTGAVLQAYEVESILRDWDIEVAQASRITDPKCRRAEAGLFVNLRRSRERLELDGEYSVRQPTRTSAVILSAPMVAFDPVAPSKADGAQPAKVPPIVLPADVVNIDVPTVQRLPLSLRTTVRAGAPIVARQAASMVLGDGRELLIVVRSRE